MNNFSAASAYQLSSARGASPVGLVVALYDTILRDLRRALAAVEAGDVEARVFELNHAITVIAHLRDVLDRQRGAEAASRLARFYELTHAMILEANVSGSRAAIQKLLDLYGGVRNAWEQAERQLANNAPAAPHHAPEPPLASAIPGQPAMSRDPSGRWSA
jgi:flagellar protein FliS